MPRELRKYEYEPIPTLSPTDTSDTLAKMLFPAEDSFVNITGIYPTDTSVMLARLLFPAADSFIFIRRKHTGMLWRTAELRARCVFRRVEVSIGEMCFAYRVLSLAADRAIIHARDRKFQEENTTGNAMDTMQDTPIRYSMEPLSVL